VGGTLEKGKLWLPTTMDAKEEGLRSRKPPSRVSKHRYSYRIVKQGGRGRIERMGGGKGALGWVWVRLSDQIVPDFGSYRAGVVKKRQAGKKRIQIRGL